MGSFQVSPRILIRVAALTFASLLSSSRSTGAQTPPQQARPIPPRLPLVIQNMRCEYGGAVPGISVFLDVSSPASVTNLRAASLLIGNGTIGWAMGNEGPLSTRAWRDVPGTASATPIAFTGTIAPGDRVHMQAFARLAMTLFASGATYRDRVLEFRLVLEATEGVLEISGPRCTPAG